MIRILKAFIFVVGLSVIFQGNAWSEAIQGCKPVEEKKIKIEGYISKKFKKQKKEIIKEFLEVGYTRAAIRPFPIGETAKVIAIGKCVPAYIARHVIQKALKYTGGIKSLVNQTFLHTHWIGIGTTTFDEPSQQIVTSEQVQQLLNVNLSTEEFQTLYRKFSVQDDTVPYFGSRPANVKKVTPQP